MTFSFVFFGSFQEYSLLVLKKLLSCSGVVTTPPAPAGRHLVLTSNPIQIYCEQNKIPVFPLADLSHIPTELTRPDFLVVAGYGRLIPPPWLTLPKIMAVNMHPSLLPKYRGRCPAEWAILRGETETGVTLTQMTAEFDRGPLLSQEKLPIAPDDTRLTLYHKLYSLGADMLGRDLPQIAAGKITPRPQPPSKYFYARQTTRQDGFVEFEKFKNYLEFRNWDLEFERKFRAFSGWPGIWSVNPQGQRVKLLALKPKIIIQEEGGKPQIWNQKT